MNTEQQQHSGRWLGHQCWTPRVTQVNDGARGSSPPGQVQLCCGWTGCGWCDLPTASHLKHLQIAKKIEKSCVFLSSNHFSAPWKLQPKLRIFYPTTTPTPQKVSQANVAWWFKSAALGLNWKKNRKTNVSKRVQQLGPEARNCNCPNQILFFKRKPNIFCPGQMWLWLILCFASLQDAAVIHMKER